MIDAPRPLSEWAERLGSPFTVEALRGAVQRGDLRAWRVVGNAWFTDEDALKEWWAKCREDANQPASCGARPVENAPDHGSSETADASCASDSAEMSADRLIRRSGATSRKPGPPPTGRSLRSV